MQDPDPLAPGQIGAALALVGLAVLMLGEAGQPRALATAAVCLVAALAAFAADALRRLLRALRVRQTGPQAGRLGKQTRAVPADQPSGAATPGAAAAPGAVTGGRWAMPPSQRDPRVHAALSMSVDRFRAADTAPAAPMAPGRRPAQEAGPDLLPAAARDTARRAALADVRNRRLARQG